MALALLAGCVLDWSRPAHDAGTAEDDALTPPDAARRMPESVLEAPPDAGRAPAVAAVADACDAGSCEAPSCAQGCDCQDASSAGADGCLPTPCAGVLCARGERCEPLDGAAQCVCKSGYTRCGEQCVDTQNDRQHCGGCGDACATQLGCQAGECEQRVHALALSNGATCALLEQGSVGGRYPLYCWGKDDYELFRDGTLQSNAPRAVAGVPAASALAMSPHHRCVVLPDSQDVRCWGKCGADCGITKYEVVADSALHTFVSVDIQELSALDGAGGSSGIGGNTCMLSRAGALACVGYAPFITLGGNYMTPRDVRVAAVGNEPKFHAVSAGRMHTCGLLADRRVACWGAEDSDVLGAPNRCPDYASGATCTDEQTVAVYVQREGGGDLTDIVSLSAGTMHSCALSADQRVYCWGRNAALGLLGTGDVEPHEGAVEIAARDQFVEVAVGAGFACARSEGGQAYCWGYRGNVGIGDEQPGDLYDGLYFGTPQPLPSLPDARRLWAGGGHACALRRSGELVCWGYNDNGQLGAGDTETHHVPTPVAWPF